MSTPDKDRYTVPVENLVGIEVMARGFWARATNEIYRVSDQSNGLVDVHKEVFGRQTYCRNGSDRRFWVWEFDGYRVFVANGYGITLEVDKETGPEVAKDKMHEYIEAWEPYIQQHLDMRYDAWVQQLEVDNE